MRVSDLGSENSVYKEAYHDLLELIEKAKRFYGCTVHIDTNLVTAKSWMDTNVYLHGDRNVVNWIAMKMVCKQHLRGYKKGDGILYVYPVEKIDE